MYEKVNWQVVLLGGIITVIFSIAVLGALLFTAADGGSELGQGLVLVLVLITGLVLGAGSTAAMGMLFFKANAKQDLELMVTQAKLNGLFQKNLDGAIRTQQRLPEPAIEGSFLPADHDIFRGVE